MGRIFEGGKTFFQWLNPLYPATDRDCSFWWHWLSTYVDSFWVSLVYILCLLLCEECCRPKTDIPGLYLTGQDVLSCGFAGALFSGLLTAQVLFQWGRRLIFLGCTWRGRMCFLVDLPGPSSPAYSPLRYCSNGAEDWYSWAVPDWAGCAFLWICRGPLLRPTHRSGIVPTGPKTDIPGLYLTGQDVLSCGFAGALFSSLLTAQVLFQRDRRLIFRCCTSMSPVGLLWPSSPAYSLLRYCSNRAEDWYSGVVSDWAGCALLWVCRGPLLRPSHCSGIVPPGLKTDIPVLYLTRQDMLSCGFAGALFSGILTQVLIQQGWRKTDIPGLGCALLWVCRGPLFQPTHRSGIVPLGAEDRYSGSGSVLVTNGFGYGSGRPNTYGSYGSESGSPTLL